MPQRPPVTPAVRILRAAGIAYSEHVFSYDRFPGAMGAAEALGVDPHQVIKTLVMETDDGSGVIVLMHGDREVSIKSAARVFGAKTLKPARAREALRWTGYQFGGTSPLGMRTQLPILVEQQIASLSRVYVNGGRRGFLIGMTTGDLLKLFEHRLGDIAVAP